MEQKSARQGKKLGIGRKLTKEQEVEIFRLICSRRPWQVGFKHSYSGFKYSLWDRDLVMQLIEQKCGVNLSDGGVVNQLKRWGFPPLNMKKQAQAGCNKLIRNWLGIHYSSVEERAQAEEAKIFWASKMKMVNQNVENDGTRRLSINNIISKQGKVHWLVIKGQFTPARQIMLLEALAGQFREKIFLFREDLELFTTKLVIDWVNVNKNRIELFPPLEWKPEVIYKVE